jgi:hypothetical protein
MILGDKPLIFEVVLSQCWPPHGCVVVETVQTLVRMLAQEHDVDLEASGCPGNGLRHPT